MPFFRKRDHNSFSILKECEEFGKRPIMTIEDEELLVFENGELHYIEDN